MGFVQEACGTTPARLPVKVRATGGSPTGRGKALAQNLRNGRQDEKPRGNRFFLFELEACILYPQRCRLTMALDKIRGVCVPPQVGAPGSL